jgi:hypothetical protein
MEQKTSGSKRMITGNELWFFFYYPCDSVWSASREEFPQCIKQENDTEESMVSIPWSINGIHSLLDVPKGTTHNTVLFIDAVIPSLIESVRPRTRKKIFKG